MSARITTTYAAAMAPIAFSSHARRRGPFGASSTVPPRHGARAPAASRSLPILLPLRLSALIPENGLGGLALAAEALHERLHVLGVLLLDRENAFEQTLRRRVAVADVVDDLAIAVDR